MGSSSARLSQRDLSVERELLSASGIFDKNAYVKVAGEEARQDPIGHYLETGWRLGLEPNPSFPGALLQPSFATLGTDEPAAITWFLLRSAGWSLPGTRDELEQTIARLRGTGLFDDAFYLAQLGALGIGLDPAIHYLTVGERMGLSPSAEFDTEYYAARNPDVIQAGTNALLHYVEWGRAEGRKPKPAQVQAPGRAVFSPHKENIILVVHETSRTGAPILGWNLAVELSRTYNLFTVRLGDGELTDAFEALSVEVHGPFPAPRRNEVDIEYALRPLLDVRSYRYAIVNSTSSRLVVEPCVRRFIPTVMLIHEFGSYVTPAYSLHSALDMSTEVIFPARIVAKAAEEFHPGLQGRSVHVMPQGMSVIPASQVTGPQDEISRSTLQELARRHDTDGTFIILGAGALELRKGVEVFLSTAASVVRRRPSRPIHFLWVGAGYRPREDFNYSVYLHEQLDRSELTEHVTFVDAVSDLESVYRITDAFFLSSRLDPLPNVTIDAAFRGIPVVAFKNASGMAEVMLEYSETAATVVDYLDSEAAADVILRLADDGPFRERTAAAFRTLAENKFDMKQYIAELDAIGRAAELRVKQQIADAETLRGDLTFDQDMFLGPTHVTEPRQDTIVHYVTLGAECNGNTVSASYHRHRRPAPGFHPRIYAAAHSEKLTGGVNPLADFVRRGKPPGPWQAPVVGPGRPPDQVELPRTLRTVLHAHFYYPELCGDFLAHLAVNQTASDLLITTDTAPKASQLQRALGRYTGGTVTIRVLPNRGRDIGPLLTGLLEELNGYDLVAHLHGKRSPYIGNHILSDSWGDSWREFLWQNLLGGVHPMMDRIVAAFERDKHLGLLFPSDPNLCGWDENRAHCDELAARMGWVGTLPDHFDFPVGTMFWMRVPALQPLLDLRLSWHDYPTEPLARDGTLLHALERLPVIACQLAGFKYAVTNVPGVSWIPPV
jgi:glycosyltransferase involved in cell wall biosynthesis